MPDSRLLNDLLADLRAALQSDPARAEKPEERFRLMRPFEKALAAFGELPGGVVDGDRTGMIASLLWQKAHPERINLEALLTQIGDDDVWVRTMAAAALGASLEHGGDPSLDKRTLYRTLTALERQRYRERSPAIAFQLEQLIDEIKSAAAPEVPAGATVTRNPYVAGPPLRDGRRFFGRDDVLDSLRQALGEGAGTRSVLIHGGRRTGKTSLLYRIRDGALGEGFLPVYFDMQSVAGKPLPAFLGAVVYAISQATGGHDSWTEGEAMYPADFDQLRASVQHAVARAGARMLVVMFDEYEVFKDYLDDGRVARQLQSLLEQERTLIVIFAGAQKVDALKERHFQLLLDDSVYMKISFLSPADAKRLVIEPALGTIEFPDAVAEHIVTLTAGHPFYTQALCLVIFDEVQRARRALVTPADVERAVARFVENPAPHLVLGWSALTLDQKVAASALAMLQIDPGTWVTPRALVRSLSEQRYPIRVGTSEMQQALTALREQDWISKREGDRAFRVTMELIRRWIAEYRSIWDLVEDQRRALIDRRAGVGKRAWAALIDLLFIGMLTGLTADLFAQSFFVAVAVYPPVFLTIFRATPGMLLMRMRVVSETGVRLRPMRGIMLGLLAALPLLMLGLGVTQFFRFEVASIALFVGALAIIAVHASMVHFGRKKRGLFDKLIGAVFVSQPTE